MLPFCTVSNGTCKILFQSAFFALYSTRHVKFCFKSVQIILNYIMLEPKIRFNDKNQDISCFFQEAIKLSGGRLFNSAGLNINKVSRNLVYRICWKQIYTGCISIKKSLQLGKSQ